MTKDIRPIYYKTCSKLGREILEDSEEFPEAYREYLDRECKEFISEILLDDFYLGNAFKYIWRLGEKKKFFPWQTSKAILEDLKKAKWYLDEFIQLNLVGKISVEDWEEYYWITQIKFEINQEIYRRDSLGFLEVILEMYQG
jgi:Protein of unknwon function (DUF3310)